MTKEELLQEAKQKWDGFWFGVRDTASKAWSWVLNNPLYSICFATIGMRMVGGVYRAFRVAKNEAKEEERRLEIYDRKTGMWVKLNRELDGEEQLYVAQELKNDRCLTEILDELGVLRY